MKSILATLAIGGFVTASILYSYLERRWDVMLIIIWYTSSAVIVSSALKYKGEGVRFLMAPVSCVLIFFPTVLFRLTIEPGCLLAMATSSIIYLWIITRAAQAVSARRSIAAKDEAPAAAPSQS